MGIETCDEQAVRRYTPNLPRVEERLKTARALRRFGVNVNFQVAPLLPYGDWQKDAKAMAEMLVENADYINILPMNDGSYEAQKSLRQCPIAKKLAEDRKFEWLRKNSTQALIEEIGSLDQKKLHVPEFRHLKDPQLKIFAA
jgi:DNA repair photolyase